MSQTKCPPFNFAVGSGKSCDTRSRNRPDALRFSQYVLQPQSPKVTTMPHVGRWDVQGSLPSPTLLQAVTLSASPDSALHAMTASAESCVNSSGIPRIASARLSIRRGAQIYVEPLISLTPPCEMSGFRRLSHPALSLQTTVVLYQK
jgi:hypothetical protein